MKACASLLLYVYGHIISHLEISNQKQFLFSSNCDIIKKCLGGCDGDDPAVSDFKKTWEEIRKGLLFGRTWNSFLDDEHSEFFAQARGCTSYGNYQ